MDDKFGRYLRYNANQLSAIPHMALSKLAYDFKEAYKYCKYDRDNYHYSLEKKIDMLNDKIDVLNKSVKDNEDYAKKYTHLKNRKLTFIERFFGRIYEK